MKPLEMPRAIAEESIHRDPEGLVVGRGAPASWRCDSAENVFIATERGSSCAEVARAVP